MHLSPCTNYSTPHSDISTLRLPSYLAQTSLQTFLSSIGQLAPCYLEQQHGRTDHDRIQALSSPSFYLCTTTILLTCTIAFTAILFTHVTWYDITTYQSLLKYSNAHAHLRLHILLQFLTLSYFCLSFHCKYHTLLHTVSDSIISLFFNFTTYRVTV